MGWLLLGANISPHEHLRESLRWGGWQLSLRTRFPLLRGKRTALGIHFSASLQWGEARWQSSHQQTVSRGCGRRLPGPGPSGNQHASPTPPFSSPLAADRLTVTQLPLGGQGPHLGGWQRNKMERARVTDSAWNRASRWPGKLPQLLHEREINF